MATVTHRRRVWMMGIVVLSGTPSRVKPVGFELSPSCSVCAQRGPWGLDSRHSAACTQVQYPCRLHPQVVFHENQPPSNDDDTCPVRRRRRQTVGRPGQKRLVILALWSCSVFDSCLTPRGKLKCLVWWNHDRR